MTGRKQTRKSRFEAMRRQRACTPYGKWTCADGREVLFNRKYKPIWQRRPGSLIEPADPEEWVDYVKDELFFDDATLPWWTGRPTDKLAAVLKEWGIQSCDTQ